MSLFRVAIDYGTSTTVAFLYWPDGRVRPLMFGDSPLLPSAVYLEDDGRPLTGRDAVRSARFDPARFEANPKRRIDDGDVLLGDQAVPVEDLVAATLRRAWQEAVRIAGEPPAQVTLTHPAAWGERRRGVLLRAADLAGLPQPVLVAEPVAAAAYFANVLGHRVAQGCSIVVCDLGAGTFDVSVVRRNPAELSVVSTTGLADLGGLDLDAVVVDLLRSAQQPAHELAWRQLDSPVDLAGQRAFRELWDGAREAKEALSRRTSAPVQVPGIDEPQHVTRGEFEAAAGPVLSPAVTMTLLAVRSVDAEIAGIFLVGGATRVPLVASMLHRATGIAPTIIEQPELVVAEGALHADASVSHGAPSLSRIRPVAPPVPASLSPTPVAVVSGSPRPVPPDTAVRAGVPVPGQVGLDGEDPPRRRRGLLAGVGAFVLAVLLLSGYLVWQGRTVKPTHRTGEGALNVGSQQPASATKAGQQAVAAASSATPGRATGSGAPTTKPSGRATITQTSPSPPFTGPITVSVALVKTRTTYTGPCPPPSNGSTVLLYADITVNGPTQVSWYWNMDPQWDPDPPSPSTLVFTAAGTKRTSPFYGGWSEGNTISYWVELATTAPKPLTSPRITWTATCT